MSGRAASEKSSAGPRRVVALMMALTGAMFLFFLLREDVQNFTALEWSDLPMALVLRYLVAMALGGALSGWLLAGFFGRAGVSGWALAGVGGVIATLLACLVGSAFGRLPELLADGWQLADLIPVMAGLLVPVFAMAGQPLIAAGWVVIVVLTHILAGRARG
ncbi:hypothetical protein [Aliiruegeria lutimaris]|uniref:Uncharacterized protein n=1 Tax=Aliiruegeria lutimaris TaxID=571298 RepID=A0A1G9NMU1_9RHOB|nr:hypothetical protein [Aliiruegeria lutimaris]SDL87709.1 hypothetical protein SAMN04488026_11259 [Aliiruegeria lutimaris]